MLGHSLTYLLTLLCIWKLYEQFSSGDLISASIDVNAITEFHSLHILCIYLISVYSL
jgi:hypothetical protein